MLVRCTVIGHLITKMSRKCAEKIYLVKNQLKSNILSPKIFGFQKKT